MNHGGDSLVPDRQLARSPDAYDVVKIPDCFSRVRDETWFAMSDVTLLLSVIKRGDTLAANQLLPAVYDELRK